MSASSAKFSGCRIRRGAGMPLTARYFASSPFFCSFSCRDRCHCLAVRRSPSAARCSASSSIIRRLKSPTAVPSKKLRCAGSSSTGTRFAAGAGGSQRRNPRASRTCRASSALGSWEAVPQASSSRAASCWSAYSKCARVANCCCWPPGVVVGTPPSSSRASSDTGSAGRAAMTWDTAPSSGPEKAVVACIGRLPLT